MRGNLERKGAGVRRAPRTILLTEDAPAYGVLAALRALSAAEYVPWLAVTGAGSYGERSRSAHGITRVPDPAANADAYAHALAEVAERIGASAVLPGTENALLALTEREHLFRNAAVGTSSAASLKRALDKEELARLASEAGLNAPPTIVVERAELQRRAAELRYPAIVKPPRTRMPGKDGVLRHGGARWVGSAAELLASADSLPGERWLVQAYLSGDLVAVCGVAWKGRVVCRIHQIAHRISPPLCGGSSYAATIAPDRELDNGVERLVELLAWSGVFQVQFVRTLERSYVIDFNPRIYGTLALAVAAGLNLPDVWASLVLGATPSVNGYRVGVHFRSEEKDGLALLAALAQRDWRSALAGLVPRRRTVHAAFSLRDPLPLATSIAKLGRTREVLRQALSAGRPDRRERGRRSAAFPPKRP